MNSVVSTKDPVTYRTAQTSKIGTRTAYLYDILLYKEYDEMQITS